MILFDLLGLIGGKEDDRISEGFVGTDPAEVAEFVKRTGISSLAVTIGTAHGFYMDRPKLDFKRLNTIRNSTDVTLVLHGASGVSDTDLQSYIRQGICKIKFATEAVYNAPMIAETLREKIDREIVGIDGKSVRVSRDVPKKKNGVYGERLSNTKQLDIEGSCGE